MLAGDTRVTNSDTISQQKIRKVFRLRNGCLFGFAGTLGECLLLKKSIEKNEEPPRLKASAAFQIAIVLASATVITGMILLTYCSMALAVVGLGFMGIGLFAPHAVHLF